MNYKEHQESGSVGQCLPIMLRPSIQEKEKEKENEKDKEKEKKHAFEN